MWRRAFAVEVCKGPASWHFVGCTLTCAIRTARQRAHPEVHLRFFPRPALQHIEALGLAQLQRAHEALDGVVPVREAVGLDQVLVDADRVAAQLHLRLDPLAMRCAARAGLPGR